MPALVGFPADACERVELVIPHPGLREDLRRALESSGYRVDARDALPEAGPAGPTSLSSGYAARVLDLDAYLADYLDPDFGPDAEAVAEALAAVSSPRTIWLRSRGESTEHLLSAEAIVLSKPFSIHQLEERLRACLQEAASDREQPLDPILQTVDERFRMTLARARRLARSDLPLVIEGELGTGRRALAHAIHGWSPRQCEAFVLLDRADIESGEIQTRAERIRAAVERAASGSLILVEPADWSRNSQLALAELLRSASPSNRWLTLVQRPLEEDAASGRLLVELQYRLETTTLRMPALRDREADHETLCTQLARRVARSLGRPTPRLGVNHLSALAAEGFPGNRIGLESRLRSAMIRQDGDGSSVEALLVLAAGGEVRPSLEERTLHLKTLERDTIVRALTHWQGNRTRASESLGISVRTLRNKIRDYGLR